MGIGHFLISHGHECYRYLIEIIAYVPGASGGPDEVLKRPRRANTVNAFEYIERDSSTETVGPAAASRIIAARAVVGFVALMEGVEAHVNLILQSQVSGQIDLRRRSLESFTCFRRQRGHIERVGLRKYPLPVLVQDRSCVKREARSRNAQWIDVRERQSVGRRQARGVTDRQRDRYARCPLREIRDIERFVEIGEKPRRIIFGSVARLRDLALYLRDDVGDRGPAGCGDGRIERRHRRATSQAGGCDAAHDKATQHGTPPTQP